MGFLMQCDSLKGVRTDMYTELHQKSDIDLYGDQNEVLSGMLHKENIKIFARHLENMWLERRRLLYDREND